MSDDYIDWETVGRRKPLGLWALQLYFLVHSLTFGWAALVLLRNAPALPLGLKLAALLVAAGYLLGIAAAQGFWRSSRVICIGLMVVTVAMEVVRWVAPNGPGPLDRYRLEMSNAGQEFGAQLAHVYGPVLQLALLLYLVFSRHVREFMRRRSSSG